MLKSKLILLIIPLFFSSSENIRTTQKPVNVVWISCEDMGPILGSYGNDVVKTPNLDKLASEELGILMHIQLLESVPQVDFQL